MKLRCKAPAPGNYGGTVDNCPAIIQVSHDAVWAWWLVPGRTNLHQNAWDIARDGTFAPDKSGNPVKLTFRKAVSRGNGR